MKKLSKLIAAAVALAAIAFAGCSNLDTDEDDTVINNESGSGTNRTATLSIHSDEDNVLFESASTATGARTILPKTVTASYYDYYLGQMNVTSGATEYTINKIDASALDASESGYTGTITADFPLAEFNFVLYAVESGTSVTATTTWFNTYAVLVAYQTADLRYHDEISFYLKANTNSTAGNGTVIVHLANQEGWTLGEGWTVTAGIYALDPDESGNDVLAYPTTTATTLVSKTTDTATTLGAYDSTAGTYTYSTPWDGTTTTASLKQGNYNLIVKYTKTDSSSNVTGYAEYNERVIVLANQTSEKTIEIPEVIEKTPEPPCAFIVEYEDPATKASSSTDTYTAYFAWNGDLISNELGFELEVMQIDDTSYYITDDAKDLGATASTGSLANDTAWESAITNGATYYAQLAKDTATLQEYFVGGSLFKNQTEIALKLKLGHRYYARIRAVNDTGNSAWSYAYLVKTGDLTDSKYTCADSTHNHVTGSTYTSTVTLGSATCFEDDVELINRYRISYSLNGGTYANLDSSSTTALPDTVVYESQHNESTSTNADSDKYVEIVTPDGVTENTYWATSSGTTARLTATNKVTLKNSSIGVWKNWLLNTDAQADDDSNVYGASAAQTSRTWLTYALPSNATTVNSNWTTAENAVQYVSASTALGTDSDNYNANVKYYKDDAGTSITQPKDGTAYAAYIAAGSDYYLRQVCQPLYAGYSNLNLIANYDGTKTINFEVQDINLYELDAKNVTVALTKSNSASTQATYSGSDYWATKTGTTVIMDEDTTVTETMITKLNALCSDNSTKGTGELYGSSYSESDAIDGLDKANYLEVSQTYVDTITFTVTKKFDITKYSSSGTTTTLASDQSATSSYDYVNLYIYQPSSTGSRAAATVKVNADSSTYTWTVPISSWTPGTYNIRISGFTDEYPDSPFVYVGTLYITQ